MADQRVDPVEVQLTAEEQRSVVHDVSKEAELEHKSGLTNGTRLRIRHCSSKKSEGVALICLDRGALAARNEQWETAWPRRPMTLPMTSAVPVLGLEPMEARNVEELPSGEGWQYEPKWDGFRCLAFKSGHEVELRGKSGKSLSRYFPEIVDAFLELKRRRLILDGELIIELDGELSFDALQMRLHPASSRITKLAVETPVRFVAFDCLADQRGRSLTQRPFRDRRRALERLFKRLKPNDRFALTPGTSDRRIALRWLQNVSSSFDGVIAKRLDQPYLFGERAMLKVKRKCTADCVVGGFRYEQSEKLVASLLLGLYDEHGLLHHVGFTSSIAKANKVALTKKLEKLISPPGFTGDAPGAPSRWSSQRSTSWQPLKPVLVAEVLYDHVTGGRFRHGVRLLRWRPDKAPRQCTFEHLQSRYPPSPKHESRVSLERAGALGRYR